MSLSRNLASIRVLYRDVSSTEMEKTLFSLQVIGLRAIIEKKLRDTQEGTWGCAHGVALVHVSELVGKILTLLPD